MSFRIKRSELAGEGIRRIAREQASQAADIGAEKVAGSALVESIHEARTRCKKLRGLLKLIRPGLGEAYQHENAMLREASKDLSAARDAAVLFDTFDEVTHKCGCDSVSLSVIREQLGETSRNVPDSNGDLRLTAFRQRMGTYHERINDWQIGGDDFVVVESGLITTYRQGRKGMKKAFKSDADDAWHEWRKRAKDHWYHVRILHNVWKPIMMARAKELDRLSELLGKDHDFALLDGKLKNLSDADEEVLQFVRHRIEARRREIKSDAERLGSRLYTEPPKAFTKRIRRYWTIWRG